MNSPAPSKGASARQVYGPTLTQAVVKLGGLKPTDDLRRLVREGQLPARLLRRQGWDADVLSVDSQFQGYMRNMDLERMQSDDALVEALVGEHTMGELAYDAANLNEDLLGQAVVLDALATDLGRAGIDLNTVTDDAEVRRLLAEFNPERYGEQAEDVAEQVVDETGTSYDQRGFTASDNPTAEELAEANRQYDAVVAKYKDSPLWMKAPNGEPAKLSERQWVQVRTPNFKNWFGDWEKAGIRERLENQEPVFVEAREPLATPQERKKEAVNILPEDTVVEKSIGVVHISKTGIRKSFSHTASQAKLDVVPYLKTVLEKAEYLGQLDDFDGKDIDNHYFATRITHDDRDKVVFMRVRKAAGRDNQLYVHDVFLEDEVKNKNPVANKGVHLDDAGRLRGSALYKSILQDIYATDKENVSKVVDGNGEPKVMFHQTDSDGIEVFDIRHKGAGTYDYETPFGVFLKPESNDIGLGNNQMPLFANIRNPVRFSDRKALSAYLERQVEGYAALRKQLKEQSKGYEARRGEAEDAGNRRIAGYDTETWKAMSDEERDRAYDDAYSESERILDEWQQFENDLSSRMKELVDRHFAESGHDGVVLERDEGGNGVTVDTTIALDNRQVKSATANAGTFSPDNPGILYQGVNVAEAEERLRQDAEAFSREVDKVFAKGKAPSQRIRMLNQTPLVLQMVASDSTSVKAAAQGGIYVSPHTFMNALSAMGHPGMTADVLKQVPEALANPIAIFDSNNQQNRQAGDLVFMIGVQDANGATVVIPVALDVKGNRVNINIVKSAYGKESNGIPNNQWFINQANRNARYVNGQLFGRWSRQNGLLRGAGVQFPFTRTTNSNGHSIYNEADLANLKGENPTLYQSAYHGTPHRFSRFSLDHVGSGEGAQAHGWGLYFAQDRKVSEEYRERLVRDDDDAFSYTVSMKDGSALPESVQEVFARNRIAMEKAFEKKDTSFLRKAVDVEVTFNERRNEDGRQSAARLRECLASADGARSVSAFREAVLRFSKQAEEAYSAANREWGRKDKQQDREWRTKYKQAMNEAERKRLTAYDVLSFIDEARGAARQVGRRVSVGDVVAVVNSHVQSIEDAARRRVEVSAALQSLDFDALTVSRKEKGQVFEVDIPENDVLLDEDKPLNEQPEAVRQAIYDFYASRPDDYIVPKDANDLGVQTGGAFYKEVVGQMKREGAKNPQRAASLELNRLGIKGITYDGYRDGRCFVVFDEDAVSILDTFYRQRQGTDNQRLSTVADIQKAIASDPVNQIATVVQSVSDLPDVVRKRAPGTVEGVYVRSDGDSARVYIVADNVSADRAAEVARHEVIGHYGIEEMLGKALMERTVDQVIYAMNHGNRVLADLAREVDRTQPGLDERTRAKEVIATMAERNMQNSVVRRVLNAIRRFLSKVGLVKSDITDADVAKLLRDARQYLLESGRDVVGGEVVQSGKRQARKTALDKDSRSALIKHWMKRLDAINEDIGLRAFLDRSVRDIRDGKKSFEQHFKDLESFRKQSDRADEIAEIEGIIENLRKGESNTAFSMADFRRKIDWTLAGKESTPVDLGMPSENLKKAGIPNKPMEILRRTIVKVVDEHNITPDQLKRLPHLLENPVMVFKSATREGNFVVVVDAFAPTNSSESEPIVVTINPNGLHGRMEINEITSAYGRNDFVNTAARWTEEGKLIAANKKTAEWLTTRGLQLPKVVQAINSGSVIILSNSRNQGNTSGENPTLYQSETANRRGAFRVLPNRRFRIELMDKANFSTFAHESAHFQLEMLADMVSEPDASDYIRQEWKTICDHIGGDIRTLEGDARIEAHEKFARSFEAYLMEGKAPSIELRTIFRRFKDWMVAIYRMLSNLDVRLSADIRQVFDRLLASDAEIAQAREDEGLRESLVTAEDLGLSEQETRALRRLYDRQVGEAQDRLRARLMRSEVRKRQKQYKEEFARAEKQAEREYEESALVDAARLLTSQDDRTLALNEAELVKRFGKAYLKELPKFEGRNIYAPEGETFIDELAEAVGFESSDDLLQALENLPSKKEWVARRAQEITDTFFGDSVNAAEVSDAVSGAMNNDAKGERLKAEMRVLAKAVKAVEVGRKAQRAEDREAVRDARREAEDIRRDVRAQYEAMKRVARQVVSEKRVKDIRPHLYLNAMHKAMRDSLAALNRAKPDYALAARLKQKEMMNFHLYRAARDARSALELGQKRMRNIADRKMENLPKQRNIAMVYKAKFIAGSLLGRDVSQLVERIATEEKYSGADPFVYDIGELKEMAFQDAVKAFDDAQDYWEQSLRDHKILSMGRLVDVEVAGGEMAAALSAFGPSGRKHNRRDTLKDGFQRAVGNFLTSMTRMESWCDMVDGGRVGEATGAWMRYVFNPMKQAAQAARAEQVAYLKELADILAGFNFTRQTVKVDALNGFVFGEDTGYAKMEIAHAFLHCGNRSNFERLVVGHGWGQVLEDGSVDGSAWTAAVNQLIADDIWTEADMDRVQRIWDLMDRLKPKLQEAYKTVNGKYFDEIQAEPFTLFGKEYKGGYVPAIYDPYKSKVGKRQEVKPEDILNTSGSFLAKLSDGFGVTRVKGVPGQLVLDLSKIGSHFNQQVLFANMAPVAADVGKLLRSKGVQDALMGYDPTFYQDVVVPWFSRAVTQNVYNGMPKKDAEERLLQKVRSRAGVATMFMNVVNAVEGFFDLTAAYSRVRASHLHDAFGRMVTDRKATLERIFEMSPYMRERLHNESNEAMAKLDQALHPNRLKKVDNWINDHAYFLLEMVDGFTAPVVFLGAYNQAIEGGLEQAEAVSQAESVVRSVYGTMNPEDLANREVGSVWKRLFTQFTGYFVQRANTIASEHSKIRRDGTARQKAALAMLYVQTVFLPAWIGAMLRKFAAGSDDDETFGQWLLDVFGFGTMSYVTGLANVTVAGQVASAGVEVLRGNRMASGRMFSSPATQLVGSIVNPRKWIDKDGNFQMGNALRNLASLANICPVVPVVPNRPVASAKYVLDVAGGKVKPVSGYDFARGVVTGRASKDSR